MDRQVRVGRLRLARRPVHRLHEAAGGDLQPEAVAQHGGDLAVGQPAPFVQQYRDREGLRPQLHRRGAERVRGLQGMRPWTRR